MEDHFSEVIVKRMPRGTDALKKAMLIAATVVMGLLGLIMNPILLIPFIILCILDTFLFPRFQVEYEYTYINGEIDVAAVYSRQSRKELETISTEGVECIAPSGSVHLGSYGETYKVVDYSSGDPAAKKVEIIIGGADKKRYLLELPDEIMEDLRWRLPGKVFLD
jgi:hypothetical protein